MVHNMLARPGTIGRPHSPTIPHYAWRGCRSRPRCERRSFVWKTIRKIDKVVGPRTRIHRISKHHHNDQDSAAAAGDAQPPISGLRTGQRIRKGRKTRTLKILNGLCGTTGIARINSARTSVRPRSHGATSVNDARAATVPTKPREISVGASRSGPPASTTSCDDNRCRRDGNALGRSRRRLSIRPVRSRLAPTRASNRGNSNKGRKVSMGIAEAANRSSARNRMKIAEMAVVARHSALSLVMNGVVEEIRNPASDARFAARGATMKRPNVSRRLDLATSAVGSSVVPCARLPNPRVVAGRT